MPRLSHGHHLRPLRHSHQPCHCVQPLTSFSRGTHTAVDNGALLTTGQYVLHVVYLATLHDFAVAAQHPTAVASTPNHTVHHTRRPPCLRTLARCLLTRTTALLLTAVRHRPDVARFHRCVVVLLRRNGKTNRRSSRGENCVTHEQTKASPFSD